MADTSTAQANSWLQKMKQSLNQAVAKSPVGKYFKLDARKTCLTRELRAGTATFLTMAYIISVNATIIADSGGMCSVSDSNYGKCLSETKSDLVIATIISCMVGSFAMGLFANLPFAIAPAMGTNAYFAYSLVGYHGSRPISYQTALAIIFVEGCAFLVISASGLRSKLARIIPHNVRLASAAGIGLFIAFVGLQHNIGLGLIGPDSSTLVTITACARTDPVTGACNGGTMQSPTFWLGMVGFVITSYGLMKDIKGSMIYGIVFVTLVSWIRGTSVTYFSYTIDGDSRYNYFKKVVDFHKIQSTAGVLSFTHFNTSEVWVALLTLLYVDVLATTGILFTLAELADFVDEKGKFEGEYLAYIVDGASSIVGSTLGISGSATYIESSAGIREGGRTGLTAVVVSFYFFMSLFFAPLFSSVPPWAMGPSLVMVGVMMMKVVKDIDWGNMKDAVPAFVTILLMPLTYSIAYGIIGGIGLSIVLNLYDCVVYLVCLFKRSIVKEQNQGPATANVHPHFERI